MNQRQIFAGLFIDFNLDSLRKLSNINENFIQFLQLAKVNEEDDLDLIGNDDNYFKEERNKDENEIDIEEIMNKLRRRKKKIISF